MLFLITLIGGLRTIRFKLLSARLVEPRDPCFHALDGLPRHEAAAVQGRVASAAVDAVAVPSGQATRGLGVHGVAA